MKTPQEIIQNACSNMLLDPEDFGYVMGPDGDYVLTEEGRKMREEALAERKKEIEKLRKLDPLFDYSEAAARHRYREAIMSMPESVKKACLNWDQVLKSLETDDES